MNGILWAILGTSIGLAAPFLYRLWRQRALDAADSIPTALATVRSRDARPAATPIQPPGRGSGGLKQKLARRFHGISLKPGRHACPAIQGLTGQRFLPEEAPSLPLSGCDQQKCQCAYSHHGDRRDPEERRTGWGTFAGFTPTLAGGNRRGKGRDRRARIAKDQPASS